MGILNKFYNWVLAALVILSLTVTVLWQISKNDNKDLTLEIVQLKNTAAETKRTNDRDNDRLKVEANRAMAAAEVERLRSEAILKGQMYDLETQYRSNLVVADGLRKQVSNLNKQIADLSRPRLEDYATTGTNNLVECSAVTVELENLARRYYSEREYFRLNQPVIIQPNIILMDSESGAILEMGPAVKVEGKLSDFETVTP